MITRKGSLALLTIACASTWSLGAAAETTAFELGSYLNFPGGRQISERDYAGAIKSASVARSIDPLVGATNLCVAYTATGAYPEARDACDLALELARRVDSSTSPAFPSETATSRALSNRGVLRALNAT